jgi:tyrosine-protein kinase Etk/Wzc
MPSLSPETIATPQPAGDDDEISLLDLAIVLAKHKKLIFGLPFVVAVIAAIVSLLMTPIYTATTKILPPQQSQSTAAAMLGQLGALAGVAGGALGIKSPNDLYIGMLRSRTVADNLIARFDLRKLYETKTADDTWKALDGNTRVTSAKDGLITVEFEDKDPKRAAVIANGYVEELYKLTQTLAVTEASQRRLFFEKQLTLAKDNLAQAEVGLKQTQESTGLIKLDEQGKAIITAVATLRAQIAAKEVQLGAMHAFATDKNPDYIVTQQEIVGLRAQLQRLEKSNNVGQGDIFVPTGKVPEAGLEYLRKLRDVKYYETIFELLAKQYEIAKADEARDASIIQVLDKASEPERRSRPKRTQIVIISALAAGFLAVLLAFVAEALEKTRQDPGSRERIDRLRRYLAWR